MKRNNKFMKSSVIVMSLIIIGKILAIIRDSLIGAKFGATDITDMYNFALGTVYLFTTISYGLTTTFIPIHTEHIQKSKKEKQNKFVNNVLNSYTIFTILITIILIIFSKYIICIFGHGFLKDINIFNESIIIVRIMLLSLIFISIQSVLTGVLQSHKEFYEPASMSIFSNIVFIVYLIFLADKLGIRGFAIATVLGFFVQALINVPKYRTLGYRYHMHINIKDKEIKNMFVLMLPVIISTSVIQLNLFVNRSFATNIFGGAVTILDFANKINTLAYEVFAIGISMVVYPTLSTFIAQGNKDKYKESLLRAINIILLIMIPASVAIGILRIPLITIIFKRGAFGSDDVALTSSALLFYCPAMIAYGVRDVLNKAFFAIKDIKTPMINSFIGILINIILNFMFIKFMQVSGLTLATTISIMFVTIFMIIDLNKRLNSIGVNKILKSFIKVSLSSIIMGIVIFIINKFVVSIFGINMKSSILSIILSFIFGTCIYFISIYLLKVEEYKYLIDLVKNKRKK